MKFSNAEAVSHTASGKEKSSMEGTIWDIYPKQEKGMIHGDDGNQLPFRKSSLKGADLLGLFSGVRVGYQVIDHWLGKEAVAVYPLFGCQAQEAGTKRECRVRGCG